MAPFPQVSHPLSPRCIWLHLVARLRKLARGRANSRPPPKLLAGEADRPVEIPHIRLLAAAAVQSTHLSPVVRPAQTKERRSEPWHSVHGNGVRQPKAPAAVQVCSCGSPHLGSSSLLSFGSELNLLRFQPLIALGPVSASHCPTRGSRRAPPSLFHSVQDMATQAPSGGFLAGQRRVHIEAHFLCPVPRSPSFLTLANYHIRLRKHLPGISSSSPPSWGSFLSPRALSGVPLASILSSYK